MKLGTDIPPRKDGTVTVQVPDGRDYVFNDESGALVADVDSESDVAWLLNTGFFFPRDETDIDAGLKAVAETPAKGKRGPKKAVAETPAE